VSEVVLACCRLEPRIGELEPNRAREHDLLIVGGVCEDDGSVLRNTSEPYA
jgi:hypothetical protein